MFDQILGFIAVKLLTKNRIYNRLVTRLLYSLCSNPNGNRPTSSKSLCACIHTSNKVRQNITSNNVKNDVTVLGINLAKQSFWLQGVDGGGLGVDTDYKEAIKWSLKSAERELPLADYNLGVKYAEGNGVAQNYREAIRLFLKSAEQGVKVAQAKLGLQSALSNSLVVDNLKGYVWLDISLSSEHELKELATKAKDMFEETLSAEQLAEAKQFARDCIKKSYK